VKPDVVYPYSKNSSHELEWSIKSLKNFEHSTVYIIGDKPEYKTEAVVIQPEMLRWGGLSRYNNVINKLLQASKMNISDDFLFMNDDIFLLEQYFGETYDRGSLLEHINSRRHDEYTVGLRNTYTWLIRNGYSTKDYETHTPILFNRKKLDDLILRIIPNIMNNHTLFIRSLYGNVYDVPSDTIADTKNPKNYTEYKILSTDEATFSGELGLFIKETLRKEEV